MDYSPPTYSDTVRLALDDNEISEKDKQPQKNEEFQTSYPTSSSGKIMNQPPPQYSNTSYAPMATQNPAGYPTPYSANPSTQVVHQFQPVTAVAPTVGHVWGPDPCPGGIVCFRCHNQCSTYTRETYKQAAFIWCAVIFCFSSMIFSWIPFVMRDMKEITHYCSFCHQKLGSCQREIKTSSKAILITIVVVGFILSSVAVYFMLKNTMDIYHQLLNGQ